MRGREHAEDESGGGAGGKLARRPFRRRTQPTPYDRPPSRAAAAAGEEPQNGWFSRLLLRPAFRLLPFLFSSSSSSPIPRDSSCSSENEQEDCDGASTIISDNQFEESKVPDASAERRHPFAGPEADKLLQNKVRNACDGSGFVEIEQRLKQKMFSRDETNRLIELLRSRTTDLPKDDGRAGSFIAEAAEVRLGARDLGASAELALQPDYQMTPKNFCAHQSKAHEIGSSPVEIARAYMESLTSGSDCYSPSGKPKIERNSIVKDKSSPKLSPSAAKAPICWQGAVAPSNYYYLTPQRGRSRIHNFPRTPYSGTVFSRSTSKFQGGGECRKISWAGWNQASTSVSSGNMIAEKVTDEGFVSVGPVHQAQQNNLASDCRGTGFSTFSQLSTSADTLKGLSPIFQGTPEKGASKATLLEFQSAEAKDENSGYMVGSSTVHPQSSATACKILRHLKGTVPFPKEKSLHLKLDIAGVKVPSMPSTSVVGGQDDNFNASVSDDQKQSVSFGKDIGQQVRADAQKVLPGPSVSKNHEDKLSCPLQSSEHGNTTVGSEVLQIPRPFFATSPMSKSSDDGFSFTFPVSVSSNAFPEPPPTPTMTSSQAVSRLSSNNEGSNPSFSFGSSAVDSGLVFSFGSISSSTLSDTSTPKFMFGSDENHRLIFQVR